jgi:hypothetical protein
MIKIQCPKCLAEIEIETGYVWAGDPNTLANGVYGCDTGCEYVTLNIECECGFTHEKGTFGYYENEEEAREYLGELLD